MFVKLLNKKKDVQCLCVRLCMCYCFVLGSALFKSDVRPYYQRHPSEMHTVETAHRQSVGRDYLQDKTKKKNGKDCGLWGFVGGGGCRFGGWWGRVEKNEVSNDNKEGRKKR